jgi:hypothetical protein
MQRNVVLKLASNVFNRAFGWRWVHDGVPCLPRATHVPSRPAC